MTEARRTAKVNQKIILITDAGIGVLYREDLADLFNIPNIS